MGSVLALKIEVLRIVYVNPYFFHQSLPCSIKMTAVIVEEFIVIGNVMMVILKVCRA